VAASPNLQLSCALSKLQPGEYHTGSIYTTAALFAEGESDVERWFQEGFAAVDMETAATFAVAEHFGMERISILYGFDNPRRREHLLLTDAEKDVRRAAGNTRMTQLALDLAAKVANSKESAVPAAPRGLNVRNCRSEDLQTILALWRVAGVTASVTDTVIDLQRAIADSGAFVLAAEWGGQIIGSVIGSFDGWRGSVYRLAVHPGFRRQGVGRALVAEVESRLIRQGAKRMTVLALAESIPAMGFWQAIGYQVDSRMARLVRDLGHS
jgi:ribosomal protein S18 acetylase RimI-like enzyme